MEILYSLQCTYYLKSHFEGLHFQSTCFLCEVFVEMKNNLKCPVYFFHAWRRSFLYKVLLKNDKSEGCHMDQNQDPIGQRFHYKMMKEKVILYDYKGK